MSSDIPYSDAENGPKITKECVACAENIQVRAILCRYCGTSQTLAATNAQLQVTTLVSKKNKKKFYEKISFWVVMLLIVLASSNGQNIFEYVQTTISGVTLDVAKVQANIKSGIKAQSGIDVKVTCPAPLQGRVGDTRQCIAKDASGQIYFVDVTIQSNTGSITWKVQQ